MYKPDEPDFFPEEQKIVLDILDLARWAPSGDNTQPWKFELLSGRRVMVHVHLEKNIYEYNNSQLNLISAGTLLESIRIAATGFSRLAHLVEVHPRKDNKLCFEIEFEEIKGLPQNSLINEITQRSVCRTIYKTARLSEAARKNLETSLGQNFHLVWYETFKERWFFTRINFFAAGIRLKLREAFDINKRIINMQENFPEAGLPLKATGLSFISQSFLKIVSKSWSLMDFSNRFLVGTFIPRLELDLLPGLFCAAHFQIGSKIPADTMSDEQLLEAGAALQRFWLTATKFGLVMQPSAAVLAFATYGMKKQVFCTDINARAQTEKLYQETQKHYKTPVSHILFQGRIGYPLTHKAPSSRSMRKKLNDLLTPMPKAAV
ncbi:MAG: nitroreductase family protein [Rhodospirillales bacterium]|nr:nitroreductase family protein [Rhodospirillales bacterium]